MERYMIEIFSDWEEYANCVRDAMGGTIVSFTDREKMMTTANNLIDEGAVVIIGRIETSK